jgi:Hsp70 protein
MTQPFIGIDFGTCNSSAACFNPRTGQAELLLNAEGDDKTPSVVYFGPNQEPVVGKCAEDQLESPEGRKRVLSAVKRNLSRKTATVFGDRRVTPLEAAALILGKIKRDAEKGHFHEPVTRAVITCPAVFDEVEKETLREAAALAGFRDVELLEEPVAAALAYAENGIKVGRCVLVYDLGGGTFDLAVLIREEGEDVFRPAMAPRGERIGGEDFDRAIYDHFDAIVRKKTKQPICPDGLDLHLRRLCRKLKESLTLIESPSPLSWHWTGKGQLGLKLNQSGFESLIEKHVERTVRLTQAIQQDAARERFHLDSVILIGGSSRIPCIVRRLHETLKIEPTEWQKQYVAVALGAAYHAQRLWGEGARSEQDRKHREMEEAARQQRLQEKVIRRSEKEREEMQRSTFEIDEDEDDDGFDSEIDPLLSTGWGAVPSDDRQAGFDLESEPPVSTGVTPKKQVDQVRKELEKPFAAGQTPAVRSPVSAPSRGSRTPSISAGRPVAKSFDFDLWRSVKQLVKWVLLLGLFIGLVIVPFVAFFPLAAIGLITFFWIAQLLEKMLD